jgi:hypothetical protein
MAEEKKRFLWWLWAGAMALAIFAHVFGFIETVGRRGTLGDRYEQIEVGMRYDRVLRILGTPDGVELGGQFAATAELYYPYWREGPDEVSMEVSFNRTVWTGHGYRTDTEPRVERKLSRINRRFSPWYIRRWAEQAYTAIHGPRR